MVAGPTKIHLIRHGEVDNPQQILYGRLPRFGLTEKGRRQAGWAGRHLSDKPIAAVFASPMLRARQTAREIIGHAKPYKLHISELLNEVCTFLEGRPGAEIDARNGDVYSGATNCYEQPGDVIARTLKFTARIRKHYSGRQVAAVTHGDIITFMVLWTKGFDLTPKNKTRLLQVGYPVSYPAHAAITTLTFNTAEFDEKPQIVYRQPPTE